MCVFKRVSLSISCNRDTSPQQHPGIERHKLQRLTQQPSYRRCSTFAPLNSSQHLFDPFVGIAWSPISDRFALASVCVSSQANSGLMFRFYSTGFSNAADVDVAVIKLNRAPEMQASDGTWVYTPSYDFGDAAVTNYGDQSKASCSDINSFEVKLIGYPKSGMQTECSDIGADFCRQKTSLGSASCTPDGRFAFRRFSATYDTCKGSSGGPVLRVADSKVIAVNNSQGVDNKGAAINFAVRIRQFPRFMQSNDLEHDCQPPGGGVDISCLIGKMASF